METAALYVRVSKELKERLDELAKQSGLSLAVVAEHLLSRALGSTTVSERLDMLIEEVK